MKDKKTGKYIPAINTVIIIALIIGISLWNILDTTDNDIASKENREAAKKPVMTPLSLLSGQYFRQAESYFSDSFTEREALMDLSRNMKRYYGLSAKKIELVTAKGQNVGGGGDEKGTEPDQEDKLLVMEDRIMELYKFDSEKADIYIDMLNKTKSMLPENTKMYSMMVPIQSEFLTDSRYKSLTDDQKPAIDYIYDHLDNSIGKVDAYSQIAAHTDEYIYFRTDHHWTALGAYYGYRAFALEEGFEPVPLTAYKSATVKGYVGRLATLHPSGTVSEHPDQVTYYYPNNSYSMSVHYYDDDGNLKSYAGSVINENYVEDTQKYGIFLGGDSAMDIIKTDAKTNRRIAVIKDSYGNAFVPFLLPHYSEIYVIDPRHYKESLLILIEDNQIDTVLFLNYIITPGFPEFAEQIITLLR